ncbi:BatD family protein [Vibrio crassostreae]|uniref:BatD family protein n=1 Tax=Vibrio crassostreae TaxID=246167 RepID=UPI001B30685A|nr:BatD family protein [Vibrio crassostreae]
MKLLRNITLAFVTASLALPVMATTITDLQKEGRFKVKTSLSTDGNVAIGEQVKVRIELSTDRWFTKGTRLGILQVPDAVALQRNKFGINSTSRSDGVTWSSQVWEIVVYPQVSGEYIVPSLPVEVHVSASTSEKVSGTVLTKPLRFNAELPSGKLTTETPWLAASDFNMEQSLSVEGDQVLEVGDSIEREVTFKASDTTAMLFPALDLDIVSGTKAYLSPIENKDQSSRGEYTAERKMSVSYIIQESGDIILPEIKVYWWDVNKKELKEEIVSSVSVFSKHTPMSWVNAHKKELGFASAVFVVLMLLLKPIFGALRNLYNTDTVSFYRALCRKDWANSNKFAYRKLASRCGKSTYASAELRSCGVKQWEEAYSGASNSHDKRVFGALWRSIVKTPFGRRVKCSKNKVLKF